MVKKNNLREIIQSIMQELEFNILFDAFDDAGCEDEGVGGGHFDGVDGSPIDLVSKVPTKSRDQSFAIFFYRCWLQIIYKELVFISYRSLDPLCSCRFEPLTMSHSYL